MQSSQSPLTEPRQAGAQRSCGLTIHTCFSPPRPSLDHIIPQPSLNAHLGLEALHPQSVLRYQSSLAFRFAFNMHTFESALPSNQCEHLRREHQKGDGPWEDRWIWGGSRRHASYLHGSEFYSPSDIWVWRRRLKSHCLPICGLNILQ